MAPKQNLCYIFLNTPCKKGQYLTLFPSKLGNIRIHRRWFVPSPRFRELIDHDLGMMAFEVTGDYNGSVSMICPSEEGNRSMAEEMPIVNFILTDMDCYASVEIIVVTINSESIEVAI